MALPSAADPAPTGTVLFAPFALGSLRLANRIVMAPMSRYARIGDTPAELEDLLAPLVDAGVDLFDGSQRRFWEPAFAGSDLNLAGWTKRLTGKPAMTVGSVGTDVDFMTSLFVRGTRASVIPIDRLQAMLDRGDVDLVGVGCGLIADSDWVAKVSAGRLDALIPFTSRMLGSLT